MVPTAAFPDFCTIALSSLGITQQILMVLLFVALFVHVYQGTLSAPTLVAGSLLCTLLLACCGIPGRASVQQPLLRLSLPSFGVLTLILHALSPVLRTLSEATTSDSIWAFSAILFGAHLTLADYAMVTPTHALLSSTVSLNLAMCASVVLSSRLTWDIDVFALLLTALQLFAIFPLLRQRIYLAYGLRDAGAKAPGVPSAAVPLTVVLAGACLYALYPLHALLAYVLVPCGIVFVSVLCPGWLRYAQRWKHELRGPWDEAVLGPPPLVVDL
ncbi:D-stereospecific aminopeptidase [Malassezia brasiliensis]|uniref:D-stereospecific aminopeptidase n=1 Tax=Malassezia brasiliensis TaxID=1821822 RepID=A0AAF0DRC3_9BASI|nr:D-stereospecific aminopeptidase [Malassezia brasiliensis]